jgi:hypothetical protein
VSEWCTLSISIFPSPPAWNSSVQKVRRTWSRAQREIDYKGTPPPDQRMAGKGGSVNRGCRGNWGQTEEHSRRPGRDWLSAGRPADLRPSEAPWETENGVGVGGGRCVLFAKCYGYVCGVNGLCIIFANMFSFLYRGEHTVVSAT